MTSLENNGRLDVFRLIVNLYASEGAEETHQEQVRVPPVGQGGAAAGGRPCPMGGPQGCPLVSSCLSLSKKSP